MRRFGVLAFRGRSLGQLYFGPVNLSPSQRRRQLRSHSVMDHRNCLFFW